MKVRLWHIIPVLFLCITILSLCSDSITTFAHESPTDLLVGDIEVSNTYISEWRFYLQTIDGSIYENKHLGINDIRYGFDDINDDRYREAVEVGAALWGASPYSSVPLLFTEDRAGANVLIEAYNNPATTTIAYVDIPCFNEWVPYW